MPWNALKAAYSLVLAGTNGVARNIGCSAESAQRALQG